MSTKRIKFVVSYDGTDFCGWAAQPGQRTVQGTLTEAVRQVSGEEVDIFGASRTDSGAHAKGQVCHFDSAVRIEPGRWAYAVNRVLPPDVSVLRSMQVPLRFDSRFCAEHRFYRYRIHMGQRDPMRTRFVHECHREFDIKAMQKASSALVGEHDFLAYTEELDKSVENTVRTLFSVQVRKVQDEIRIDIVGTAFLRGMMRRMSGALLEVGLGRRPVEEVKELLTSKRDQLQWPEVLPAKGLTLMRVVYGRPLRDHRTVSSSE